LQHGDPNGEISDAQAGDKPAHHHMNPRVDGRDLDDVANDEDGNAETKRFAPAEPVGRAFQTAELAFRTSKPYFRDRRRGGRGGVRQGGGRTRRR
jgi:hypothetical protein